MTVLYRYRYRPRGAFGSGAAAVESAVSRPRIPGRGLIGRRAVVRVCSWIVGLDGCDKGCEVRLCDPCAHRHRFLFSSVVRG